MSSWVNASGCLKIRPRIPKDWCQKLSIGPWVADEESDRENAAAKDDESVLALVGEQEIAYGCFHFAPNALARIISTYLLPNGYEVNGIAKIDADDLHEELNFKVENGFVTYKVRMFDHDGFINRLVKEGLSKDAAEEQMLIAPFDQDDVMYRHHVELVPALEESNALAKALSEARQMRKKAISGKELGGLIVGFINGGLESSAVEFCSLHKRELKKLSLNDWVEYLAFVDLGDSRIPVARQLLRWGADYIPAERILSDPKLCKQLTGSGLTLLMIMTFEQNFPDREKDPARLSGADWTYLLRTSEDFDGECLWQTLSGRDWSSILALRPDLIHTWNDPDLAIWGQPYMYDEEWYYLMSAQPKLRKYKRDNARKRGLRIAG